MKSSRQKIRRRCVRSLVVQGYTNQEIADELGVHRNTIARDLKKIEQDIDDYFDDHLKDKVRNEIKKEFETLRDEYWELFKKTGKEGVKKDCLAGIRKTLEDKINLLQSIGVLSEEPDKLDFSGGITVNFERFGRDGNED